ncbi:fluoride efflux transporter family protein [Corynebacterium poyangense]|uniref:Fluoride-specific ion channel n=1 Tax=Corynebacterium poyangense TaxID=2684405 RepID=A0A7H0SSI7_9CORY|nr:fluoride efflux transporter family protein [Corynebacterium poyangense]MBZ8178193.1 fluoride efflux transporter family protein [Corynebacterium poyangense]QNQ91512.1 fluoride efflux transporter family protein [Corynebacterium poyangense]
MREGFLVSLGASLGAIARFLLTALFPASALTLVLINCLGSWAMGRFQPGPFLGTGFLGGFTSFSAFILLYQNDHGLWWMLITILGCMCSWLLGEKTR